MVWAVCLEDIEQVDQVSFLLFFSVFLFDFWVPVFEPFEVGGCGFFIFVSKLCYVSHFPNQGGVIDFGPHEEVQMFAELMYSVGSAFRFHLKLYYCKINCYLGTRILCFYATAVLHLFGDRHWT